MDLIFLKNYKQKFSFKVFSTFAVLIFLISLAFIAFFINLQHKSLYENLISNGENLIGVLADSSRIGVYSGNQKLLLDPVSGMLQQDGVQAASIYNTEGKQIIRLLKPDIHSNRELLIAGTINSNSDLKKTLLSGSPHYFEFRDRFEFWSPVMRKSGYLQEDAIFYNGHEQQPAEHLIGFAGIALDKSKLNQHMYDLFYRGILIGFVFLIIGFLAAFILAKIITKPVYQLTRSVTTLGKEGKFERVSVETEDELGNLAQAFNMMAVSLKNREHALQKSELKLRQLSYRCLKAQEEERRRLSRELHDGLGQTLALLKGKVRSIGRELYRDQSLLLEECEQAVQYIKQIIDDLRRLSRDLSPSVLEDLGLSTALRVQSREFAEHHSITESADIEEIDDLFSQEAQINLYRFCQEALTNIYKHAQAHNFSVTVKNEDGSVIIIVEDDGKGFNVSYVTGLAPDLKGLGLTTLEERARMLGGTVNIWSKPDLGTRITLTVPVPKQ